MAAPISAKTGTIKHSGAPLTNVRNISLTETSDNKAFATNDTGGIMDRIAGHKDFSGTCELYADGGSFTPPQSLAVGGVFTMAALSMTGKQISAVAIIDSIEHSIDIESGDLVGLTLAYSGKGAALERSG